MKSLESPVSPLLQDEPQAEQVSRQIHPTAIVHPSAKVGSGVTIGPYSVIGPNTAIGDNTVIDTHAVVEEWTTIGCDCAVGAGPCWAAFRRITSSRVKSVT